MAERKIHGPIFQFECEVCDFMGDCWDTEAEAVADMEAHDCVACAPAWVRDEIERLRAELNSMATAQTGMSWHNRSIWSQVARLNDEVAQLNDEIEGLRAAGDALYDLISVRLIVPADQQDDAIEQIRKWREARRG